MYNSLLLPLWCWPCTFSLRDCAAHSTLCDDRTSGSCQNAQQEIVSLNLQCLDVINRTSHVRFSTPQSGFLVRRTHDNAICRAALYRHYHEITRIVMNCSYAIRIAFSIISSTIRIVIADCGSSYKRWPVFEIYLPILWRRIHLNTADLTQLPLWEWYQLPCEL